MTGSQVERVESGVFGNSGKHFRSYFFVVMKCPSVRVWIARMLEFDVGTALGDNVPPDLKQRF